VLVEARTLPKTIVVCIAMLAIVAILAIIPYDFDVFATGTLQPVERRNVFAAFDGTVDKVFVKHGQDVTRGQLLAQLRNTDLDVAITEATGQSSAMREQLASVERMLVEEGKQLSPEERNRLSGQRGEMRQRLDSLACQLDLLHRKREKLRVESPMDGEVTTWNVDEMLHERPVRQGQILLNVADTTSDWELELRVPEDQMGHIAVAQNKLGPSLGVIYRLATDPATDYQGTVRDVHMAAEIHGEDGNSVLVRVAIDDKAIDHLQPGAECRARVHCGRRSLGYVLLHDLIAFVQSRILFRI
jgi:multidrug efflux pump subunit AcrA (membrane-fusion protein)